MNDRRHCNAVRTLLIAYRSGEVSPLQRKRVESHLEGCRACRAELDFGSELERTARAGPEPLDDLKKRQILGQIHAQLDAEVSPPLAWRRPLVLAPAGALLAAAALALLWLSSGTTLPTTSGWLATPREIRVFVPEPAAVAFENTEDGPRIRLETRTILARYDRLPEQAPLRIATPHGEAIIRGTVFFVEVEADRTRVGVQHGTVEVRDRAGHSLLLGPGEEAELDGQQGRIVPATSPSFAALRETFPPPPTALARTKPLEPRRARRPFVPGRDPALAPPAAPGPGPDPKRISRIVGRALPRFQGCYERGLKNHPGLAGRVVARLTYGPDGVIVEGMYLLDELQNLGVTDCLRDVLLEIDFPPAPSEVTVEIPLVFAPSGVRQGR